MNIQNRSVKFNFGRTVFQFRIWISMLIGWAEWAWMGIDEAWILTDGKRYLTGCVTIFQKMAGLQALRRVTVKLNFWWKFSSLNKKIFKVYKPLVFINNAKCLKCLNRFIKMHVIIYQHVKPVQIHKIRIYKVRRTVRTSTLPCQKTKNKSLHTKIEF